MDIQSGGNKIPVEAWNVRRMKQMNHKMIIYIEFVYLLF